MRNIKFALSAVALAVGFWQHALRAQDIKEFVAADPAAARAAWLNKFPDLKDALNGPNGMKADDVDDLIRMQKLLLNTDEMVRLLKPLNKRMAEIMADPGFAGKKPTAALSQALAEKEAKHGFPGAKVLPLGILSADLFNSLPANGYIAKDTGAGLEHGEYTHRLQWYAMMTAFEDDLADDPSNPGAKKSSWRRTPFELFTSIGMRDMKAAKRSAASGAPNANLWAHLMDQAGSSAADGDPTEGFRKPDDVTKLLRKLDQQKKTGGDGRGIELISEAVAQRYQKRFQATTSNEIINLVKLLSSARPAEKAKMADHLGIKLDAAGQFNPTTAMSVLAQETYRVRTTANGSYSLWDPADATVPLVVKPGTGDLVNDEAETDAVARYVRSKVFGLQLRPEQAAVVESDIRASRLARVKPLPATPVRGLDKYATPAPSPRSSVKLEASGSAATSSTHGTPPYDEIPAELRRKAPKPVKPSEPEAVVKFDPTVRAPTAIENQYDTIPLELRRPEEYERRQIRKFVSSGLPQDQAERMYPKGKTSWKVGGAITSAQAMAEGPSNRRPTSATIGANRRTARNASNVRSTNAPANKANTIKSSVNRRSVAPAMQNVPKPGVKPPPAKPKK